MCMKCAGRRWGGTRRGRRRSWRRFGGKVNAMPLAAVANPWLSLPRRAPFVLPEDAPYVATFNRTASKSVVIETELMPGPFLGAPTSPVIILALNPGVSPRDFAQHRDAHFRRRIRDDLAHRS